jgi:hypothetical protein
MPRKPWDRDGQRGSGDQTGTFELEAFTWSAPDELEVAGRFKGLIPATEDTPALVVHGDGETHRLDPVPDGGEWPPADGEPWRAAFGWNEPPTPFDAAELRVGGLVLALPQPGSEAAAIPLAVEDDPDDVDPPAVPDTVSPPDPEPAAAPEPAPVAVTAPADRLREHADLVLARDELSKARAAHDAALAELASVRQQLEDERTARAADSERFREDVDSLRAMAEESIAAERQALSAELAAVREDLKQGEATAARTAEERDALGAKLVAARDDLKQSEATAARTAEERDAALAQVAPLEATARELEDMRARVDTMAQREADLRAQLIEVDDEVEDLRLVCAHVSERLQAVRAFTEEGE